MSSEEDENDFGMQLSAIQDEMKRTGFQCGQVSGWDDDTEGIEEERNPTGDPEKNILKAAETGDLSEIVQLLSTRSDLVHVRDKDGYTPLHRASYNNHVQAVDYLLQHGAEITAETEDKWHPLHSACRWNNAHSAAKLLEHGADINALTAGGQTPLHLAASNSYAFETLQLLLMHPSIDATIKNGVKETAADIAARTGRFHYLFEITEDCVNII